MGNKYKTLRGEKVIKKIIIDCQEVLVDDEDYMYILECYDLKINTHGYVYCSPKEKFKGMGLHSMTMHKLLKNPEKKGRSIVVDHYDGNKLNNQKDNLRVTSHTNNMRNRKVSKLESKTSKYKGGGMEQTIREMESSDNS